MSISYRSDIAGLSVEHLPRGFFDGWAEPRSPAEHLEVLRSSDVIELAVDDTTGDVVGFITALTDGIQSAFISLLEVLPEYRGQGIGSTLVRRVLMRLGKLNDGRGVNVDLSCDEELVGFYERLGMSPGQAMWVRPHIERLQTREGTASAATKGL